MGKGEQTREAVLEFASARACTVGLEGLSIGELARELGMSKSGLFAHFQSKAALQVQVLGHASDRFVEEVIRPALRAPRGEARVRALFEMWVAWFHRQQHGCIFVAAITELDDRPGEARDALASQQRDWLDVIETVARTAVTSGEFRADLDTRQFALDMYSIALMLHLTVRLLALPDAMPRANAAFENLLKGARA
ncbi:MAG: TetR/AcrR family transcriptional regulator [Alphaproteobacteria bacterium]|nr:TetR/AcrR family transcriptional regulator [Alphaproteobacteria bacterium]